MMHFGCCLAGASFVPQTNEAAAQADPLEQLRQGLETLAETGYDFAELTVGTLTQCSAEQFDRLRDIVRQSGLKVPVVNSFIPPRLKLTGGEVDEQAIEQYVDLAMSRAKQIGTEMIIFGSGGARSYPEGFDRAAAMGQIEAFLRMCDRKAGEYGVLVVIEPLNQSESNLIHTVGEALELCRSLALPHIRVLADAYHMLLEQEAPEIMPSAVAEGLLAHVHIADRDRVFPGLPATDGADFRTFFRVLRDCGYGGRISAECRVDNFAADSSESLNYVRALWAQVEGNEMAVWFEIEVKAGKHDRLDCPVAVRLPEGAPSGAARLENSSGDEVGVQRRGDEVYFVLDHLAAGESRTYRLELGGSEANAALSAVELKQQDQQIDVSIDGQFFTSYVYDSELAKPYMGPVIGPYGDSYARLDFETKEHPHHRSLWLAIGDVNGHDMWNEPAGVHGRQIHQRFTEVSAGPVFAEIAADNVWASFKGKPQVDEHRSLIIYNTPQRGRIVDLEVTFTANYGQVEFGATKEAGPLGIRVAESMKAQNGGTIANAYGSIGEEECWGKRSPWCDYYGEVGGHTLGIAAFDHPGNEHYPTYWHVRNYGLHAANNFYFVGGQLIRPGDSVRYRYRVFYHDGDTQQAKVGDRYQDYIHPPKVVVREA